MACAHRLDGARRCLFPLLGGLRDAAGDSEDGRAVARFEQLAVAIVVLEAALGEELLGGVVPVGALQGAACDVAFQQGGMLAGTVGAEVGGAEVQVVVFEMHGSGTVSGPKRERQCNRGAPAPRGGKWLGVTERRGGECDIQRWPG
jgi:hypothetical protein